MSLGINKDDIILDSVVWESIFSCVQLELTMLGLMSCVTSLMDHLLALLICQTAASLTVPNKFLTHWPRSKCPFCSPECQSTD